MKPILALNQSGGKRLGAAFLSPRKLAPWSLVCYLGFVLSLSAQDFQIFQNPPQMFEGGLIHSAGVICLGYRFQFKTPPECQCQASSESKKISFLSKDEKVAMTFQISTNYAGGLPDEVTLKTAVARSHPGLSVFGANRCFIGSEPGWSFDVERLQADGRTRFRIRHVFVSFGNGSVEFTFSTSSEIFKARSSLLDGLLGSFSSKSLIPSVRTP